MVGNKEGPDQDQPDDQRTQHADQLHQAAAFSRTARGIGRGTGGTRLTRLGGTFMHGAGARVHVGACLGAHHHRLGLARVGFCRDGTGRRMAHDRRRIVGWLGWRFGRGLGGRLGSRFGSGLGDGLGGDLSEDLGGRILTVRSSRLGRDRRGGVGRDFGNRLDRWRGNLVGSGIRFGGAGFGRIDFDDHGRGIGFRISLGGFGLGRLGIGAEIQIQPALRLVTGRILRIGLDHQRGRGDADPRRIDLGTGARRRGQRKDRLAGKAVITRQSAEGLTVKAVLAGEITGLAQGLAGHGGDADAVAIAFPVKGQILDRIGGQPVQRARHRLFAVGPGRDGQRGV